jgi:hypothetical protein
MVPEDGPEEAPRDSRPDRPARPRHGAGEVLAAGFVTKAGDPGPGEVIPGAGVVVHRGLLKANWLYLEDAAKAGARESGDCPILQVGGALDGGRIGLRTAGRLRHVGAKVNVRHSGTAHTRSYGVNVPFMQLERRGWDIHALSADRTRAAGRDHWSRECDADAEAPGVTGRDTRMGRMPRRSTPLRLVSLNGLELRPRIGGREGVEEAEPVRDGAAGGPRRPRRDRAQARGARR